LRSPFSGIIGLSGLWLDKNDTNLTNDPEQIMRNIHLSAKNALNYLDDLLLWGKMISDGVVLQKQPIQVGAVCREIIHEFEDMARMKHISIELSETETVVLVADPNMFKTILRNLLYNALKFTNREGWIKIIPSTTAKGVELTVQDNGVGMDPATLETLWAFSTHRSTKGTANELGTGFGLSICKQLIEKHQGSILATSEKGQGSVFTIQFPA
jgi:signal transduction histidine kinase